MKQTTDSGLATLYNHFVEILLHSILSFPKKKFNIFFQNEKVSDKKNNRSIFFARKSFSCSTKRNRFILKI